MGSTRETTSSHQRVADINGQSHSEAQTSAESVSNGVGDLQNEVLVSLRRIIRATDLNSRKLGKETGLTTPQLVVMNAVCQSGMLTASEIAARASLSQATITGILNRLESHGLIIRARSKEDKRRVQVSLTREGKDLLASAPQPLQKSFVERFSALESWEQHLLVASLNRLASLMDAEHLDASPLLTPGDQLHHD